MKTHESVLIFHLLWCYDISDLLICCANTNKLKQLKKCNFWYKMIGWVGYRNVLCMCMCVCVCVCVCKHACSVISDFLKPHRYSLPGSFAYGILQERKLQWVAISSYKGSSQPGVWTRVSCVSCTAGRLFTHWAIGEVSLLNLLFSERRSLVVWDVTCQKPGWRWPSRGWSVIRATWPSWASVLKPAHGRSLVTVPCKAFRFPKHLSPHLHNRDLWELFIWLLYEAGNACGDILQTYMNAIPVAYPYCDVT